MNESRKIRAYFLPETNVDDECAFCKICSFFLFLDVFPPANGNVDAQCRSVGFQRQLFAS